MSFCTNCGAPVEGQFCVKCGTKAPVTDRVGPPPPPPPQAMSVNLVLHGNQGKTLFVAGGVVRIEKQGGMLTGKREKTIPIRNITSVEVKQPGAFVGFIQFSIAGGRARDSSYTMTGGSFDAVQDENSVVFKGQEPYEMALKIKAYIENWSGK